MKSHTIWLMDLGNEETDYVTMLPSSIENSGVKLFAAWSGGVLLRFGLSPVWRLAGESLPLKEHAENYAEDVFLEKAKY